MLLRDGSLVKALQNLFRYTVCHLPQALKRVQVHNPKLILMYQEADLYSLPLNNVLLPLKVFSSEYADVT